mmetsp:Transcript_75329/g.214250  ORF Transcript_75329/g.214250 Transcript_75329/m.214250 type:complete len:86 (+) Transcript_75329:387-644(+)
MAVQGAGGATPPPPPPLREAGTEVTRKEKKDGQKKQIRRQVSFERGISQQEKTTGTSFRRDAHANGHKLGRGRRRGRTSNGSDGL